MNEKYRFQNGVSIVKLNTVFGSYQYLYRYIMQKNITRQKKNLRGKTVINIPGQGDLTLSSSEGEKYMLHSSDVRI